eukprot:5142691-Amphidinium_carterae.1
MALHWLAPPGYSNLSEHSLHGRVPTHLYPDVGSRFQAGPGLPSAECGKKWDPLPHCLVGRLWGDVPFSLVWPGWQKSLAVTCMVLRTTTVQTLLAPAAKRSETF